MSRSETPPLTSTYRRLKVVAITIILLAGAFSYWNLTVDAAGFSRSGRAGSFNGFDVRNAIVPKSELLSGGPPRDGIPAMLEPRFQPADNVPWLNDQDEVVGVEINGVAKAYPLRILIWHELVNDEVGGNAVLVTYCPLCGSAMVFDREFGRSELTFGVSGMLYQSDVLMYDHQTESLWSQLKLMAVSGKMVGTSLPWLPSTQSSWASWRTKHPQTLVLVSDAKSNRDYGQSPYQQYMHSDAVMFPVPKNRDDLPQKSWVIGVIVNGQSKAYPLDVLAKTPTIDDRVAGGEVKIRWDAQHGLAEVRDGGGNPLPNVKVYWFAWQAFYPDTLLHGQ